MADTYTRDQLKAMSLDELTRLRTAPGGATLSQGLGSLSQAIDEEVSSRYAYSRIEDKSDAELKQLHEALGKGGFSAAQAVVLKVLADRGASLTSSASNVVGTAANVTGTVSTITNPPLTNVSGVTGLASDASGLVSSVAGLIPGGGNVAQLANTVSTVTGVVAGASAIIGTAASLINNANSANVANVQVPQTPVVPSTPVVATTASVPGNVSNVTTNTANQGTYSSSLPQEAPPGPESEPEVLDRVNSSFKFENADLPKFIVFELEFAEELSKPYLLRLRVTGPEASIDESVLVGEACTLTLVRGGLVKRVSGIVSEASFSGVGTDIAAEADMPAGVVNLTIVPAVALLGQRRDNRIFQEMTVPDIILEVLEAGLADYSRTVSSKLQRTYPALEYCTQYDETDLAFVQRLMAQEGICWSFVQGEASEELVLFDDVSGYQQMQTADHGAVPLKTTRSDYEYTEVIQRFLLDTRLTPTSAVAREFNWSTASAPSDNETRSTDSLKRDREQYLGSAPVTLHGFSGRTYGDDTGANQAQVVQETALSRGKTARGNGEVTGMSPGMTFELTNALRPQLNRAYVVTKVVHRGKAAASGAYLGVVGRKVPPLCEKCPTEDKCTKAEKCVSGYEISYSNSFECVPDDVLYRPDRPPRRFVQTSQTAVVVGDEEITTDDHGRIKVQFHWDRKGANDTKSSCWIRVSQPSAGIGFGHVFIPRKDMEVVVTFLEGNPDKPLVTGCVYNGLNVPPYQLPAEKTRSVIRSWSTPSSGGYNELSFEDAAGSEEVYMQAQKNLKILVKNNKEEKVRGHEDLTVTKTRTRKVGMMENVAIGGAQNIVVGFERTVAVTGFHTVAVGLYQSTNVGFDDSLNVGKNRSETIGKNSAETVGETKNVVIGKDHSFQVTKDETISIGGNRSEEVIGTLDYTVGKEAKESFLDKLSVAVTKGYELQVEEGGVYRSIAKGDDHTLVSEGNALLTVSKGDSVETVEKGDKEIVINEGKFTILTQKDGIILNSKEKQIELVCGDASIILKKSGDIELQGKKITLTADGDIKVKGGKIGLN